MEETGQEVLLEGKEGKVYKTLVALNLSNLMAMTNLAEALMSLFHYPSRVKYCFNIESKTRVCVTSYLESELHD